MTFVGIVIGILGKRKAILFLLPGLAFIAMSVAIVSEEEHILEAEAEKSGHILEYFQAGNKLMCPDREGKLIEIDSSWSVMEGRFVNGDLSIAPLSCAPARE